MAAPARPRRLSGFEWACLGVVAVSFLFRLDYVLKPDAIWDSAWYLMLGRSFAERGDFWIRWTDPAEFSGYWPPLFPILVSGMVRLFGASYQTLAATATLASALLALAVLLTTWDLMGRTRAFAAMALVAASPAFLGSDMRGMGESTLALMVVLALWAFLKSLERPVFLPLAALFGLGAYLSKANLGLPFVAAGLVA
ncbi:MAG TPA: glycosyltransferase family 39 protein, partial [Candidatus Thermoplasmatota archaeon]|nr:glycosyltransferase family 39 protein [Candidatus Thermoplasmatota archaeon]